MAASQLRVKVLEKKQLAGNFWELSIERGGLLFEAGQYVSLKVNEEGERRSYSLASSPDETNLTIMADVTPMGLGSKYILGLNVGDEIEILGPLGMFMVTEEQRAETTRGFVLVGTGSGIAPLRAMVRDLLINKKEKRPVQLNWGMRYEQDLFWTAEFLELQKMYSNFKFDLVLSKPTETWPYCKGHVGDCLVGHQTDFTGWQAYLCGNKEMMSETSQLLINHGVPVNGVHVEKFN